MKYLEDDFEIEKMLKNKTEKKEKTNKTMQIREKGKNEERLTRNADNRHLKIVRSREREIRDESSSPSLHIKRDLSHHSIRKTTSAGSGSLPVSKGKELK